MDENQMPCSDFVVRIKPKNCLTVVVPLLIFFLCAKVTSVCSESSEFKALFLVKSTSSLSLDAEEEAKKKALLEALSFYLARDTLKKAKESNLVTKFELVTQWSRLELKEKGVVTWLATVDMGKLAEALTQREFLFDRGGLPSIVFVDTTPQQQVEYWSKYAGSIKTEIGMRLNKHLSWTDPVSYNQDELNAVISGDIQRVSGIPERRMPDIVLDFSVTPFHSQTASGVNLSRCKLNANLRIRNDNSSAYEVIPMTFDSELTYTFDEAYKKCVQEMVAGYYPKIIERWNKRKLNFCRVTLVIKGIDLSDVSGFVDELQKPRENVLGKVLLGSFDEGEKQATFILDTSLSARQVSEAVKRCPSFYVIRESIQANVVTCEIGRR
ncbi:MAG: hypothetical protein NC911_05880 [Candidatus Omnitrophica bacterium]|nr:hypothetical protein [Candidatus Omnitrophota bacterium]